MAKNILIVDDQPELNQILRDYFRARAGYEVFTAADGSVALDLIKTQNPNLVLLDMKLPSVNGLEVLKVLRQDYPDSRVIVMTAYDAEYKKEIDLVGYDALFIKPIPFEELKEAVDTLLRGEVLKTAVSASQDKNRSDNRIDIASGVVLSARIAVVELQEQFAKLIKTYLENLSETQFSVAIFSSAALHFKKITEFKPDIVLYDILEIADFSEVASRLVSLPKPPKEIILFGDPKFKWEDVDTLIKEGMSYVSTPLSSSGSISKQSHDFELPAKEAIDKLVHAIKTACLKHNLTAKKEG